MPNTDFCEDELKLSFGAVDFYPVFFFFLGEKQVLNNLPKMCSFVNIPALVLPLQPKDSPLAPPSHSPLSL